MIKYKDFLNKFFNKFKNENKTEDLQKNSIQIHDLHTLEINDKLSVLNDLDKFFIELSVKLNVSLDEILDFFNINLSDTEQQERIISKDWHTLDDNDKLELKKELPSLNFENIERLSEKLQTKSERYTEILQKSYKIFKTSLDKKGKPKGLYLLMLNTIKEALNNKYSINDLNNTSISILFEILKLIIYNPYSEMKTGFFYSNITGVILKDSILLNSMKIKS